MATRLLNDTLHISREFIIVTALIGLLCFVFSPRWETNDDVAMSMIAHGYGFAAFSSPNIVFSNIVWGYIVRSLPSVAGIPGYSVAALSVILVSGTGILYSLRSSALGWIASLSVLLLILVRPVLFPQFTITAGLVTLAAICLWERYGRTGHPVTLVAGAILAFVGYLVRSQEFLLVLLVGAALIPWRALATDRAARITAMVFLGAVLFAASLDYASYRGVEWQDFNALNATRLSITDRGADGYLKQHPEILSRYGYTSNDVDLLRYWFFIDPAIANPSALKAMVFELGPLFTQVDALSKGWLGVKTLATPVLLPLLVPAVALFLLRPRWRVMIAGVLAMTCFFVIGLLGRPGILRIYIPVASLLLVAPVIMWAGRDRVGTGVRARAALFTLLVAAFVNTSAVITESIGAERKDLQLREGLRGFPSHPVLIWGGVFPYEAINPVLGQSDSELHFRYYALGVFALAPFSLIVADDFRGERFAELFASEKGIPFVADELRYRLLRTYCEERLHGSLDELADVEFADVSVGWRRCKLNP